MEFAPPANDSPAASSSPLVFGSAPATASVRSAADLETDFEVWPLTLGFPDAFDLGGLFASTFSVVLLADDAVGLVIRSKKLPSTGAKLLLAGAVGSRDTGRWAAANDAR